MIVANLTTSRSTNAWDSGASSGTASSDDALKGEVVDKTPRRDEVISSDDTLKEEGVDDTLRAGDEVLRDISFGNHPTAYESIIDVSLVTFLPLIFTFIAVLLPLSPPVPGIKNNWVFIFAYAPYVVGTAAIGNLINVSYILKEPPRWISIPAMCLATMGYLCLIAQFVTPFPIILVNVVPSAFLGISILIASYFCSPQRFTPAFNKMFKCVNDMQRNTNGFFFVAILYVIAFFKSPHGVIKFLLTTFFHAMAWSLENHSVKLHREFTSPPHHYDVMNWFQIMTEVFSTLTFPVISKTYFIVMIIIKLLLLFRFPILLSDMWWKFSETVTAVLNSEPTTETGDGNTEEATFTIGTVSIPITKPMAKILWFFVPTTYTHHEYAHRVLVSFFFTLFSYIWTPTFYLMMSSFLRYGYNKDYYSFKSFSWEQFQLTLIYAGASIVGFSIAFVYLSLFIAKQWNYMVLEHGLYKLHQHVWFYVFSSHNAIMFTMCLLVKHLDFLYDVNQW